MALRFPANLRYTKDHEWVRSESDGQFTIGITDFAQRELSDVVFVELPSVDDTFAEGDEFGTVEAVKTVSSLYMPLAGTVVAINTGLNDDPSVVNNDPYEAGWMIRISAENEAEWENLLKVDAYQSAIDTD